MTTHLLQFFKLCDPNDARSVDREAFRRLCHRFEIAGRDADVIFDDLDHDNDDRISFEDFSRGFSDYLLSAGCAESDSHSNGVDESEGPRSIDNSVPPPKPSRAVVIEDCIVEHKNSGNKEAKIKWLIDELQSSEKRHLVPYLENAVEDLLSNLHSLQEDKAQLEKSWKREKRQHEHHLKRMEEEMDSQVKEAEMKLRLKAQADVEKERKNLQSKMDVEMDNLQVHLALFEKVNAWLQTHPQDNYDVRLDEVKHKLDDAVSENRHLRISLLDTQTNIALMRSELLQLRTLYEEKCRELNSEREKILEVLNEQDHLSHQLNLLHDVNRRLQDTNDSLRNTLEQTDTSPIKMEGSMNRCKSGSIIGDYFEYGYSPISACSLVENSEMEENVFQDRIYKKSSALRRARSMDLVNLSSNRRNRNSDQSNDSHLLEDQDSGVSTAVETPEQDEGFSSSPYSSLVVREEDRLRQDHVFEGKHSTPARRPFSFPPLTETETSNEDDVTAETRLTDEWKSTTRRERIVKSTSSVGSISDVDEMPRKKISDIVKQLGIQGTIVRTKTPKFLPPSGSSSDNVCYDSRNPDNEVVPSAKQQADETNADADKLHSGQNNVESESKKTVVDKIQKKTVDSRPEIESLLTSVEEDLEFTPNGPADKSFNVIFVGDAGVGKSSFALRISKGVFMRHMSSTLGVDFLMRTLRVDGLNVEVQLWDTAGQERFRSITKSYFRKADGVMLLYDCTCEHSFLNVRQWSADVDSMSSHRIPLMLVANKIDLRPAVKSAGKRYVSTEEGQNLAKECDATFIEASAKDGSYVLQALANLVRAMSNHKELQMSSSTMQLTDAKPKKNNCCGK